MTESFLGIDWAAVTAVSTISIAVLGFVINAGLRANAEKSESYRLLVEYRQEIIGFSSEFFDIVARANVEALKKPEDRDQTELQRIAADLSKQVDKGRFIFPNYQTESGYGKEKGPGFEGRRREPLDAIMAAYCAVQAMIDAESNRFIRLSHRNLIRADQPFSDKFNPVDCQSLIIEARRSYVNSVVPTTFPREWHMLFEDLFGAVKERPKEELEKLVDDQVAEYTTKFGHL